MHYISILLLCIGTLFFSSSLFVDAQTAPKWYAGIFCVLCIGTYIAFRLLLHPSRLLWNQKTTERSIWIIALMCLLQAIYGILQYTGWLPTTSQFACTGSFDNPAGFAASLVAGVPLCFFLFKKSNWFGKAIAMLSAACIFSAIIFSGSRTGILSVAVVIGVLLYAHMPFRPKTKLALSASLLVILLTGLYFLKKDSADGRLLIWRCSWNMIVDKPFSGHGQGGFEAHYMDYQADYFRQHTDSKYSILADNIQYPFNEFLYIGVNHGIIGLLLLLLFVFFISFCYHKQATLNSDIAMFCLLSIGICALFSYPMMYPFVWLILVLSCITILYESKICLKLKRPPAKIIQAICLIAILASIYIGYMTAKRVQAELSWCRIAYSPLHDQAERVIPYDVLLKTELADDRYFLYNYSAELHEAQQIKASLAMAHACRKLWSDYDLELLIAKNYECLKRYPQAEQHYLLASQMCPNRLIPLYQRVLILDKMGQKAKAKALARLIVKKEVKIHSFTTRQMKRDMKRYIQQNKI